MQVEIKDLKKEHDEQLMQKAGIGDEAAIEEIINRWKNPLINFFYRSLRSFEQSEDLTQTVFIRLYRAAPNYVPKAKFSTYLFQIARHLLINEYRRSVRKPLTICDPLEFTTTPANLNNDLRIKEIEELFSNALDELPETQKTALLLYKQQELSYKEISDTMDASESAVKTWIFRARQNLKEALKDIL